MSGKDKEKLNMYTNSTPSGHYLKYKGNTFMTHCLIIEQSLTREEQTHMICRSSVSSDEVMLWSRQSLSSGFSLNPDEPTDSCAVRNSQSFSLFSLNNGTRQSHPTLHLPVYNTIVGFYHKNVQGR